MTFIDDNYLDGIITRLSAEHKEKIMRTARRLNLPDDDVLFLVLRGALVMVSLDCFYLRDISQSVLTRDCVCAGIIQISFIFASIPW